MHGFVHRFFLPRRRTAAKGRRSRLSRRRVGDHAVVRLVVVFVAVAASAQARAAEQQHHGEREEASVESVNHRCWTRCGDRSSRMMSRWAPDRVRTAGRTQDEWRARLARTDGITKYARADEIEPDYDTDNYGVDSARFVISRCRDCTYDTYTPPPLPSSRLFFGNYNPSFSNATEFRSRGRALRCSPISGVDVGDFARNLRDSGAYLLPVLVGRNGWKALKFYHKIQNNQIVHGYH